MKEYDVHVASEGFGSEELTKELENIGYKDDRLTDRYVTFAPKSGSWLSSCPIIGVHMTKKPIHNYGEIRTEMNKLKGLLEKYNQVGYAHSEAVIGDITIQSREKFKPLQWPFERFDADLRDKDKEWDLHMAIPKDNLPKELEAILMDSGMYYMDVMKNRNNIDREFRVYTIQGISPPKEGRQIYEAIAKWCMASNVPHAEIKCEASCDMFRVGKPRIVPPTIDDVLYVNGK